MRRSAALPQVAAAILLLGLAAPADAGDARAGGVFAQRNCGSCHAVGRTGASPNPRSPPLRVLARKYKLEDLEEALAEGIVTGHNAMPEFSLTPPQIDDLLAHIRQLRRR